MKRILVLSACLAACAPTSTQIRSGLLLTARGVVEANRVCAAVAREMTRTEPHRALNLSRECTRVSDVAFDTLQAGERALDAALPSNALCAVASGLDALKLILKAAGGITQIPPAIADAVVVASGLGALVAGDCEGVK